MGTNQRYSSRLRNKRRVNRVLTHLKDASLLLYEMVKEYEGKHDRIEAACKSSAVVLDIIYTSVENIQAEI